MGLLADVVCRQGSGAAQPTVAAGRRPRLIVRSEPRLSNQAAAQISAAGLARRYDQRQVVPPSQCSRAEEAGAPIAALSQDADADEKKDEYNRRMQQQMGWEDANPYEYHYGVSSSHCCAPCACLTLQHATGQLSTQQVPGGTHATADMHVESAWYT